MAENLFFLYTRFQQQGKEHTLNPLGTFVIEPPFTQGMLIVTFSASTQRNGRNAFCNGNV